MKLMRMFLLHCYSDLIKNIKKSGQYNIDLMLYSTPINLISLTRKIKTERCLLYIHIISGKLLSFMISISILCSIFVIRAHTLFASHIR